jgi:hypothetical protein
MMMMSLYSQWATCGNRYRNINKSDRLPATGGKDILAKTTKHAQYATSFVG